MTKELRAFERIKDIIREDAEDIDNPKLLVDELYTVETALKAYAALKDRIAFLKEHHKRELDRGYDDDGIPFNETNWYITANIYNCMDSLEYTYKKEENRND